MNDENKVQRAQARKLNRSKDRRKHRMLVCKQQANSEGISKEAFEKRFPHLPLKVWYAQRYLTHLIDLGFDFDEASTDEDPSLNTPHSI